MEEKIIKILGGDHPDPIRFSAVLEKSKVYGLYTYDNGVYAFVDGMDCDFNSFSKAEKSEICDAVLSRKWVVDPTMQ